MTTEQITNRLEGIYTRLEEGEMSAEQAAIALRNLKLDIDNAKR